MRSYNVTGMSCAACSARVERAVSSLEGVSKCSVNLLTNSMQIDGTASDESIILAVESAGYGASPKSDKKQENVNKTSQANEIKGVTARLVASIALLLVLMYLSMGYVMWSAPLPAVFAENPLTVALAQLLLSGIILVINQRFFISGVKAIINRSPNMDTLVALGSGVSFAYSVYVVFRMCVDAQNAHLLHGLYFESAAMILTLITVGKLLEARAKGKTTDAINSLIKLSPKTATVVRDGVELKIPAREVRVGDIFLVRPGESVAVDGVVVEGVSSINEAALTGESIPVDKQSGDRVLAATVNTTGFLKCRAEKVGDDTAIASVIRMVEDASATKAPIAKVADRVSGVFVPVVISIAVVTFAVWMIINGDFPHALERGISVLVISCPCALGLATPVAIMVGSGVGAKLGVLFKNAEALELTGKARTVVLDKTGTITRGEPEVTEVIPLAVTEAELLSLAAAIESASEHPLASAVCRYAEDRAEKITVTDFEALAGSGVRARLDGEEIYGGSYKFISTVTDTANALPHYERLSGEGKTPLLFTKAGKLIGIIAVADAIREDSAEAIAEMKKIGMRVVMLTGDNSRTAEAIGRAAGVDEVISDVLPDGKEAVIKQISENERVIMVGDGINDAPALTRADVGMAIGGGTDIAIESASVVLMRDSLSDVARAVKLGRSVLNNIYQNLGWAFIYNLVGIPLAAGLFGLELDPMFGAAAMSLSSFSVVMNALRLNTFANKYNKTKKKEVNAVMKITMKINGMMCPHCEARVRDVLSALECVELAEVSHKDGTAIITPKGECDKALLKSTVEAAGYEVVSVD
ncbi:MAG: heavy metal translocating P-type ATPase [Clostridia bacterium]|nr:heavy metal translocating P-type ATPase [Clostridia bacterium]